MADVKATHFDEIPYYQGPNAIAGIKFHTASRELGVTAWGMNVWKSTPAARRTPNTTTRRTPKKRSTSCCAEAGLSTRATRRLGSPRACLCGSGRRKNVSSCRGRRELFFLRSVERRAKHIRHAEGPM